MNLLGLSFLLFQFSFLCYRHFGVPPLPSEQILSVLEPSFEHSAQEVRTEAFALVVVVEIICSLTQKVALHKWLGDSLRPFIASLRH